LQFEGQRSSILLRSHLTQSAKISRGSNTENYGMSSESGLGGGNVACAWAVKSVLNKAGIPSGGTNPNPVFSVQGDMISGKQVIGQQISLVHF